MELRTPLDILRDIFGYPSFRGLQAEIVSHVADGDDALVIMPTGSGKSLCYQIPAILRPGVGVVISPLIALMQNQVRALLQAGVRAAALNSAVDPDEGRRIEARMRSGELELVYVAPERLTRPWFLGLLERCPLALFAIDEAHCVSEWGFDFRPEYLELAILSERFPDVPRIALTATADPATRVDILERLRLDQARVFAGGFDRPNIRYRVQPKVDGPRQLLAYVQGEHRGHSGIVYCRTRERVERLAAALAGHDVPAVPYHAGLDADTRHVHQERFLEEDGLVVVATVAFGMGIDKPDVRFVAHVDPPKSLEAYHQETGRAGRDGLPADAWMIYGLGDVIALRQLLAMSEAEEARKRVERHKLDALLGYCETIACRRRAILDYFGEERATDCGNCDNCLEPPASWDGTIAAQKALSCVARTGSRFGAVHLIDVLLGKDGDRVQRLGHDRLSVFGVGTELQAGEWRSVFRQLVAGGLLEVDVRGHGGLRLTLRAKDVLGGLREVRLRKDLVADPKRGSSRVARAQRGARAEAATPEEDRLWEALRALRMRLAKEQGVPPYVVFHDSTLLEMLRRRPATLGEMTRVPGIGEAKLQRYGQAFLDLLSGQP